MHIGLDKMIFQKEEVIITGYDTASGMEWGAEETYPLRVKAQDFKEN